MRAGMIVWVEIPVRDLQRSADFYTELFGWSFEPDEERNRWIFAPPGGGTMGAITTGRMASPGGVRFGVAVDDLRVTSDAAIRLGGGPSGQTVQSEVGRGADVIDPDGNHFWVYELKLGGRTPEATQ